MAKSPFWVGVVEDIADPLMMNRVRVRVFHYHLGSKIDIPTDSLPWAMVVCSPESGGGSGVGRSPHMLKPGTWVSGYWLDGEGNSQIPIVKDALPSNPMAKANPALGFNDPSGIYPRTPGEPDVNRAARGIKLQSHEDQDKSRTVGVDNMGQPWIEPPGGFAAQYPHNQVFMTANGLLKEYDDTPNAQRIREAHPSGTFYEIQPDGTKVQRQSKDNYDITHGVTVEYVGQRKIVNVQEDMQVRCGNMYNLVVENGAMIITVLNGGFALNVNGSATVNVTGNLEILYSGNVTEECKGERIFKAKTMKFEADETIEHTAPTILLNES